MSTSTPSKTDANPPASTNIMSAPIISSSSNNNNNHTEQPQTKRQKIEKIKANGTKIVINKNKTPPPDIIDTGEQQHAVLLLIDSNGSSSNNTKPHPCSSLSSSISTPSSSHNNSPTSTPASSRATSFSQLLNVQNMTNVLLPQVSQQGISSSSEQSSSADEVDRCITFPDLISVASTRLAKTCVQTTTAATTSLPSADESSAAQDMREFEESLTKQCLCGVSERTLRKPFQSHYSLDAHGQERIANLSEWRTNKLLQFLSNLQLLFDIYLKQNSKGFVCARIMDVCDALIRNDHNLIDEIIVLAGYSNAYVQFLAGRVLASFLVIANQEMDDDWLKKLVDNLFNFDRLDHVAVQQIHFSLEIIKRIVEWKDVDLHPLENKITDTRSGGNAGISSEMTTSHAATTSGVGLESAHSYMHFQTQQPTLENNYFAVHFRNGSSDHNIMHADNKDDDENVDDDDSDDEPDIEAHLSRLSNASFAPPLSVYQTHNSAAALGYAHHANDTASAQHYAHHPNFSQNSVVDGGCHITFTDCEIDTTHLKCNTIKILENKWPALVKNMSALIANHLDIENAENCILNFLQLWENIISVKANLSIVETKPFYAQLDTFELLLNQSLSCTVYRQMLCLFNEALCYGSTLALQDMLPDETCSLARQIVHHVKDLLESLPRRQPENIVSLIGFKRLPIVYTPHSNSLQSHYVQASNGSLANGDVIEMDKTILQKMVLLVLKAIAVRVKLIRCDSSDSSIDSTDYEDLQGMVEIERIIRDVFCKLESFIKHTLEFHPECHFSKILIHLFDDQDDHLIEAMVCTLDVTTGISFRNNAFPELVSMLNPVYTFLEFLKMISNSIELLISLLVNNETCFLLYLLRFLKYIRNNWSMFEQSCYNFGMGLNTLDEAMSVLIQLRLEISRLVSEQKYPYDISPVLRLLECCESLYEGNELS